MVSETLRKRWETLESEELKHFAEFGLHHLAQHDVGRLIIRGLSGGRVEEPALNVEVAGLRFDVPIMAGAGWDKLGWTVDGLYWLGFAGAEVGTVPLLAQPGNERPRMWTDKTRGVALNRLGFNTPGVLVVDKNLERQQKLGVVGVNIGINKTLPEAETPASAHAKVARYLHKHADYIVINVSSPNTPGLRDYLKSEKAEELRQIIRAVKRQIDELGKKPLFLKLTVDLGIEDVYRLLQLCAEEGVDGIIDTNTTINQRIKAKYGWANEAGGLSGDDYEYRQLATDRMRKISRYVLQHNLNLSRIGVGAINSGAAAIERIEAGAQALQVVTAIRQRKFRVARSINEEILDILDRKNVNSLRELVGASVG